MVDQHIVKLKMTQAVRRWARWTRARGQFRLDDAKAVRFYWSHRIAKIFFAWKHHAHEQALLYVALE